MKIRLVLLSLLSTALVLARPPAAPAEPAWLPEHTVATGTHIALADLEVAADGTATVAWADGASVALVRRPPGGPWEAPERVSSGAMPVTDLELVVNARGDVVVLWRTQVPACAGCLPSIHAYHGRVRTAGGAWSPAARLSDTSYSADQARVVLDEHGTATATWRRSLGTGSHASQVQVRTFTAGTWQPVVTLDPTSMPDPRPDVATGPHGQVVVAWRALHPATSHGVLRASHRLPGSDEWSEPYQLTPDSSVVQGHDVVVDRRGAASVVWSERVSPERHAILERTLGFAGWTSALPLTPATTVRSDEPLVASVGASTRLVVYRHGVDTHYVRYEPLSGVSASGLARREFVARELTPDRDGRVAVLGDAAAPVAIFDSSTGSWSTPSTRAGGHVALGLDGGGSASTLHLANGDELRMSTYDAAGPRLEATVSGTGVAGQEVVGSAAASDVWSGATVTWDWGDGTGWSTVPRHTYTSPGDYRITVRAVDGVQNVTSLQRDISVGTPPAVPSPPSPTPAPPTTSPSSSTPQPTGSPAVTLVRRPAIRGTALAGARLRATPGSWSPTPSAYRYRWLRDGTVVAGATARTYRVRRADVGARLVVQVRALRADHRAGVARSRAVRVRRVADRAPRLVALPVKGRLVASPPEVGPGRLVLLTGTVGDDLPRRVWLQVRRAGGWTRLAHRTTRVDGLFRFTHRAPRAPATLHFRVLAPGSQHFGLPTSVTPTRRVRVTEETWRHGGAVPLFRGP
ncbi:PKD domain-containing protein [Nocardioides xinjiangensis]|uniref:PKD domain-containing protein n=1 Tax=Nocardioides xinjiangensis TaxID=2817376 RepID=UPI001B30F2EE|nr:PKD domain-containing protein [Nocardioides sp. SYSU D00778]